MSAPVKKSRMESSDASNMSSTSAPYMHHSGQIQLILGPINSGKTSESIRRVYSYWKGQFAYHCVTYKFETGSQIISDDDEPSEHHTVLHKPAERVSRLADVDITHYQVIGIDDGHHFPDLVEKCEEWANKGRIVIVAARDATFEREPYDNVAKLIPKAEEVVKLKAICIACSGLASFSFEARGFKNIATCRVCYFKMKRAEEVYSSPLSQIC